jgi:hypothetical protein
MFPSLKRYTGWFETVLAFNQLSPEILILIYQFRI